MPVEEVLKQLDTSPQGLTHEQAQRRLDRYGPNSIQTAEAVNPWVIFLHQFTSPLIYVLLAAMVVTLVIGEHADAAVIALVLMINATIGFIQEYRAENAMAALMSMVAPRTVVRRENERCEIGSSQLVPGDIVLLESGHLVPADLRIIDESELRTDDSILTGESNAISKSSGEISSEDGEVPVADRRNMVFMGTSVASGRARGVVVATGADTQIGLIADEMRTTTRVPTPLQQRMHRFGNRVSVAIVLVSILAFLVGLSQGVPLADMFLTAVAIAVAAIPEGLPVVMTVALAVSVRRMAKRNAIIRRLPAVETLGSCTVIMSDKTGTLTENRMTVQSLWTAGQRYKVTGVGLAVEGRILDSQGKAVAVEPGTPLYRTLLAGLLANEADLHRHRDGTGEMIANGDPTEVALLVAAAKTQLNREDLLDAYPQVAHVPFESERQFSATLHQAADADARLTFVKGAPERVLEMCDRMLLPDGSEPLDREAILAEAREMASQGLRLLAMATGETEQAAESTHHGEPQGLIFLGLVGMMDPPRTEVINAIAGCHQAGIRVLMVTGDHASTAAAIAEKIRLVPEGKGQLDEHGRPRALSGADIEQMTDEQLRRALADVAVYARVNPTQKLRIVLQLRELGQIVAVTGDGVNDAPALKSAHLGAAMGRGGTDVAKEASEMVLADDNFATIYAAVQEGRTAFSNIRKATDFLLSTSVGVVMAIFGTFILAAFGIFQHYGIEGLPLLMLPAQILWLNVVTAGTQDVSLAFEPGEKEQYTRPPRNPQEGLLSRLLVERSVLVGILLAIVALVVFTRELQHGASLAYAQVATLTAIVIFKALHVGACRSETLSIFQKNFFSNRALFVVSAIALLLHIGALYFPPTQALLGMEPLEPRTWITILLFAPSVLVLVEVHKLLRGRTRR